MYVEPMAGAAVQAASPVVSVKTVEAPKAESKDGELNRQTQMPAEVVVEIQGYKDAVSDEQPADGQLTDDQRQANQEKRKKMMEQISSALNHSIAKFGIHEKTNHITIKIVDKDTKEVIKEIPPEKSLDLMVKRLELAGILLDQKL